MLFQTGRPHPNQRRIKLAGAKDLILTFLNIYIYKSVFIFQRKFSLETLLIIKLFQLMLISSLLLLSAFWQSENALIRCKENQCIMLRPSQSV